MIGTFYLKGLNELLWFSRNDPLSLVFLLYNYNVIIGNSIIYLNIALLTSTFI